MKKIILLIPMFLTVVLNAQVAYYDAIQIKKFGGRMTFSTTDSVYCLSQNNAIYKILKYYVPIADSSDVKKIENNFDNNPFIRYCNKSFAGGNSQVGSKSIFSSNALSNIRERYAKMVARNSFIVSARRLYKTKINVSPIATSRTLLLNMILGINNGLI